MTAATLPSGRDASASTLMPTLSLIGAMASLCVGTSFAKSLFPEVGAQGTTAYRIVIGAIILIAFWRPWRFPLTARNAAKIALYGVTLACMNLLFYMALRTLPLGVAIAIEFTGPLTLAVVLSRRAIDFVWIACALAGLVLLIPTGQSMHDLDPVGIAYALSAAVCWALYIIFGKMAGNVHGGQATSLGLLAATMVALPVGAAHAGMALLDPKLILAGVAVGILSSALPYSLEMVALRRLPQKTFGVLLSMEPAMGALAGVIVLNEHLSGTQWLAICGIIIASAGCAATARRQKRAAAN
ncbi:EamA family transporter [Achromobacter ruhlandii]|jgi:inner membrane transporter RhtA|uniref:EamA family transporter n=1 Tax=Achromobacter ruhlandii TaxID=72557 RepID=UPI00242C050D|nr:EamA family transporter [Achromobacter ruhlandii]MCI1837363.1 EamA family transporter [Achromobacter ruhlandii]